MLVITFYNDNTGDDKIAHYDYFVRKNGELLARGRVENHVRATGWQGLILKFAITQDKERRNNVLDEQRH